MVKFLLLLIRLFPKMGPRVINSVFFVRVSYTGLYRYYLDYHITHNVRNKWVHVRSGFKSVPYVFKKRLGKEVFIGC